MHIRNNNGPNNGPWGTIQSIYLRSELKSLIVTKCVLFLRYEENQIICVTCNTILI